MFKLSTAINPVATLCLLLASSLALAEEHLVVDESLGTLPPGYLLWEYASDNATADLQFGDLGASNGLIFDASWNVPVNGYESVVGLMYPDFLSLEDFQLNPSEIGGFTSIRWTLDAEVISSTMTPPDQGIFVELRVYQLRSNGTTMSFGATHKVWVSSGQSVSIDVTLFGSDFGPPSARPDFSATGLPIAFALQFDAFYGQQFEETIIDARTTAQNWTVSVNDSNEIYSDGFEPQTN